MKNTANNTSNVNSSSAEESYKLSLSSAFTVFDSKELGKTLTCDVEMYIAARDNDDKTQQINRFNWRNDFFSKSGIFDDVKAFIFSKWPGQDLISFPRYYGIKMLYWARSSYEIVNPLNQSSLDLSQKIPFASTKPVCLHNLEKQKERFVYVVDSYATGVEEALENLGFDYNTEFEITGAGGAIIYPHWVTAKKLIVFVSTFHGNAKKAVEFAKEIKESNPSAKVIFRSGEIPYSGLHEVFDGSLEKEFDDQPNLVKIVKGFFEIN